MCAAEFDNIFVAKNATVFPFRKYEILHGRRVWSHGVETREEITELALNLHRYGKSVINSTLRTKSALPEHERLCGTWLYGGILFNHFGHFFAESIHRLWAWNQVKKNSQGVVFLSPSGASKAWLREYMQDALEFYKVPASSIKIVKDIVEVDQLYLPLPGSGIGMKQPSWYRQYLLPSNVVGQSINSRKVFISRRNFLFSGKVAGLSYLEKMFENRGFEIVFPETLSFHEQLIRLRDARVIVWEESSNIHLLDLLSPIEAKTYLIKRRPKWSLFEGILREKSNFMGLFDRIKKLPVSNENSKLLQSDISRKSLLQCIDHRQLFEFSNKILTEIGHNKIDCFDEFRKGICTQERVDIEAFEKGPVA